jgi:hypothetical protein
MREITTVEELQYSIRKLELKQAVQSELLKEDFFYTYDRFRLINLLKSALKQKIGSQSEVTDVIGMAIGLATGYLTKRIFVGTSGNPLRKLLGSVLQLGVMSFVSRHSSGAKSIINFLFNQIIGKRE